MGLTKEVRDFFTNRITALLDTKIKQITRNVSEKKVLAMATERFCEDYGLDPQAISRYNAIKKQRDELEKEANRIAQDVADVLQKATKVSYSYWHSIDNFEGVVSSKYRDAVIADLYPDVPPQLEQINKIKNDVQAVVMLATTETKLVNRLTAVLQKYGGGIPELLEYLPEQDF
jgi:wobble nucleotide-excising tRNase